MFLKYVSYKGRVITPMNIVNNDCYYFKNGRKIDYAIRLADIPDYYVAGESLHLPTKTASVDGSDVTLSSRYHYKIQNDNLIIKI